MDFNFDEWAELHKKDPVGFEVKRREMLLEQIEKAPAHIQPQISETMKRLAIIRATNKDDPVLCAKLMLNAAVGSMSKLQTELEKLASLTTSEFLTKSE